MRWRMRFRSTGMCVLAAGVAALAGKAAPQAPPAPEWRPSGRDHGLVGHVRQQLGQEGELRGFVALSAPLLTGDENPRRVRVLAYSVHVMRAGEQRFAFSGVPLVDVARRTIGGHDVVLIDPSERSRYRLDIAPVEGLTWGQVDSSHDLEIRLVREAQPDP